MVDDIKVGLPEKFMPPLYLEAAGKKKPPVDLGGGGQALEAENTRLRE